MNSTPSNQSDGSAEPLADQTEPASVNEPRNLTAATFYYARSTHEFNATNPPPHHNRHVIHPYIHEHMRRDPCMSGSPYQAPIPHGLQFPPDDLHRAPYHGSSLSHHANTVNLPRSGLPFHSGIGLGYPFQLKNHGQVGSPIKGYRPRVPSGDITVSSPPSSAVHRTPSKDPKPLLRDDEVDQHDVPRELEDGGCTCKKSKCLKLYCICFANKAFCDDNCRCLDCSNDPQFSAKRNEAIHAIILRNPAAFDNKIQPKSGKVEASQHKNGCKCRKSMCLKKYCECFHAQVNCGITCRCVGCKNMPPGSDRPSNGIPPSSMPVNAVSVATNKNNSNVMDAAHNLAFLKSMTSCNTHHETNNCISKNSSSGSLAITTPTLATSKTEEHQVNQRNVSDSKPKVNTGKDELVHDTFAADLLLRAASVMIERTSHQGHVKSVSSDPCPSQIGLDVNYPKRQLQQPFIPGMSVSDSKRQKFEKDCKSPNSAADTNTAEHTSSGLDEKTPCKMVANACEKSFSTRILNNLHFEQEQT